MGALAVFGIENDGLNLAANLLLLFLVVLWFALVYWTYADARRRLTDPMLIGCATAAALFPFVGTVVYMIVRPPEYLEDRHERELEIAGAEARLANLQEHACPYCDFEVEKSFLRCPSCLRRLKEPCTVCGKPLDPRWQICPYCEAEVAPAQPEARPRQRQRRTARSGGNAGPARAGTSRPPGSPPRAAPAGQAPGDQGATAESPAPRPPERSPRERPSSA